MDYYKDVKKYIEYIDSRLDCSLIISKDKANKIVDYLIDNVIDGIKSEWGLIKFDNYGLNENEEDLLKELKGDIIIISKIYEDDMEIYFVEDLFKHGSQLYSSDYITFIDNDIMDKINFNKIISEETKVIK